MAKLGSEAYPTKARGPRYSVLDNRRLRELGQSEMPHWSDALARYLEGRAAAGRDQGFS